MDLGELVGRCAAGAARQLHLYEAGFAVTRRFSRDRRYRFGDVKSVISDGGMRFQWNRETGPSWPPSTGGLG